MNRKLYLGTIVSPHGYKGKANVKDVDEEIPGIASGAKVSVGFSENFSKEFTVDTWKQTNTKAIVKFKEINTDREIKSFSEQGIFADSSDIVSQEKSDASKHEFTGMKVLEYGSELFVGTVLEYWQLPANDAILVETDSGNIPIPVIDEVVKKVDRAKRIILIELIDGLLDLSIGDDDER